MDRGAHTQAELLYRRSMVTAERLLGPEHSAVGEVQNGEGVYGLRRALALAGAQTRSPRYGRLPMTRRVIVMVDYYRHLLRGEGRSAALRRTQRAMLASAQFAHPCYWASFIAIGNWNPLPPEPIVMR